MIGRCALAAAWLALAMTPARAEDLLLALSSQQITIASNYAGSDVTLFGAIRGAATGAGPWDIVVTARGPATTLVVRRKEPVGPLWANRASRAFFRLPSYLSVASTRPLSEFATPDERRSETLGLLAAASVKPLGASLPPAEDAGFVSALVRLQGARALWSEEPEGVWFLDRTLFRATIHLPPNVPFGAFEVEARLFSEGRPIARESITFRVVKAGFEARIAELAQTWRLAYGAVTALLALLFGWTASVIFRRD